MDQPTLRNQAGNADLEELLAMELSENQAKFIQEADEYGLEIISYSGRGMFGKVCPAVQISRGEVTAYGFQAKVCRDSLGLGEVWYAQH